MFPKGKTNVCRKGWRTIGKPKFQTRVSSLRNKGVQAGRNDEFSDTTSASLKKSEFAGKKTMH